MKQFICIFIPLNLVIVGVGFATITLPMPGSDPLPEWFVRQEAIKGRIFETIIFPAH